MLRWRDEHGRPLNEYGQLLEVAWATAVGSATGGTMVESGMACRDRGPTITEVSAGVWELDQIGLVVRVGLAKLTL